MKRALAGLLLLLFLPGVLAGSVGVTLSVGETVNVNGLKVSLVDVSATGEAAIKVNGSTYVLTFGENATVGGVTIVLGSVFPGKGEARIFFLGDNLTLSGGTARVELTTPLREVIASPGARLNVPITVKNNGEDSLVPLNLKLPRGWSGKLEYGGVGVLGLYLHHGESASLTLSLRVGFKEGKYPVKIRAGETGLTLWVSVTGSPLKAYVDCPGKEATAGENVSFTLHVLSTAPLDAPLKADPPAGWGVRFLAMNEHVRIVRVDGTRTILVLVSVPSNATLGDHVVPIAVGNESLKLHVYVTESHAGENGTLVVRVVDEESGTYVGGAKVELIGRGIAKTATTLPDGTAILSAPEGSYRLVISKEAYKTVERKVKLTAGKRSEITVSLHRLPYYFDVLVPAPVKSAVLGETVTYEVVIRNLGKEDDTYTLELRTPPNWGGMVVESPSSRTGISSTYVKAGEEKRLYVVLIPPDTANIGNYTANLTVKSEGSGVERTVPLRVQLVGSYGMAISLDRYSVKVKAGEDTSLRVRVYNTGTSPLTNVRLKVEAPQGWSVEVTPERVATIEKNGEATFTVRISVPGSVDAGDYVVTLRAESDQKTAQEQVRVTVVKGSGATYIGLGMILTAMIILVVILRKYGRR